MASAAAGTSPGSGAPSAGPLPVYLEVGSKRVFACAVDWPGWSRSGRDEHAALESLAAYLPRFAPVAARAGLELAPGAADDLVVVERVPGDMTTDFGAPGALPRVDREPVDVAAPDRLAALVEAAWGFFDDVLAVTSETLRKGPRGGGRDRDPLAQHVLSAEAAYARKVGVRHREPRHDDREAVAAMRRDLVAVVGAPSDGDPVGPRGWPVRQGARRIAWHVLDHAWEAQDKTLPDPR